MTIICVDFDGVIYPNFKYLGTTIIKGDPVPGAVNTLVKLAESFTVVVHSARCDTPEGVAAIRKYLDSIGLGAFEVLRDKPRAKIYIDDRAVCFNGDWARTLSEISSFKQWQTDDKLRARIIRSRRRSSRRG